MLSILFSHNTITEHINYDSIIYLLIKSDFCFSGLQTPISFYAFHGSEVQKQIGFCTCYSSDVQKQIAFLPSRRVVIEETIIFLNIIYLKEETNVYCKIVKNHIPFEAFLGPPAADPMSRNEQQYRRFARGRGCGDPCGYVQVVRVFQSSSLIASNYTPGT